MIIKKIHTKILTLAWLHIISANTNDQNGLQNFVQSRIYHSLSIPNNFMS